MKYTEFKNDLENGKAFSIYLFEGEDAYFRERGLTLLKSKFVSEPSLNFVNFDSDVSNSELLTSLEGYPFMSEKRLTVVREFYPKSDYIKRGLGGFLDNPSPTSILVILNEKPCELIKKYSSVCVVECSKQDSTLIARWIKAECAKAEVLIDGETAKLIVDFCLSDMTRIENETKKLCSYALKNGQIDFICFIFAKRIHVLLKFMALNATFFHIQVFPRHACIISLFSYEKYGIL